MATRPKNTNSGTGITTQGMLQKQGQLRTAGRKIEVPDKKGVSGVYGANPSFPNYPQSIGKDTLPTKFAESPIAVPNGGGNKMKTVNGEKTAKRMTVTPTARVDVRNKYDKVGKMMPEGRFGKKK